MKWARNGVALSSVKNTQLLWGYQSIASWTAVPGAAASR